MGKERDSAPASDVSLESKMSKADVTVVKEAGKVMHDNGVQDRGEAKFSSITPPSVGKAITKEQGRGA